MADAETDDVGDADRVEEERAAEAEPNPASRDMATPEADALEQLEEVEPGERLVAPHIAPDAPEADVLEQSIEVPTDDDRREAH